MDSGFDHSFARTECEQTFANGTKIAEFSRVVRLGITFGARGHTFKSHRSDQQ